MASYKPDGWPTVIPRLFARDVEGLVGFLITVFGAGGKFCAGVPSEMRIGESVVMVSDGGGLRDPSTAFLYVYVENADKTYDMAIRSGAQSIEAPQDMPYGDRRATIRDPWGNTWQIATRGSPSKT